MWTLGNRKGEHRGRGEKEREANCKRPLMIENKLRADGGTWAGNGLDGGWALRRAFVKSTEFSRNQHDTIC